MSDPTWFYGPGSFLTRVGMLVLGPLHVEGLDRVPREGPFILVANHFSNFDPLIIGATVGDLNGIVVRFMAKDEMLHWPVIGWLARQAGVFFVRRGEGDRAAQRTALANLAAGRPVGMFPEGTRSRTGIIGEGHGGAALLAMRSGVPVLPASITGTERVFPRGARIPRRHRVDVRIGTLFALPHQPQGRLDRVELAAGSDRIMREIAAMLPAWQRGRYGDPPPAAEGVD
jgi:1-acyl-sn-glycerol-3-phosphate acyltransferase